MREPHWHTIFAAKVRSAPAPDWKRERIELPDGDFLDLDSIHTGSNTGVILQHGLEGSTARTYMRGMANALVGAGLSVVAVNFRGCSGEPNRLPRSYHSGATEDLRAVLDAVAHRYETLHAVGFSLGGNMLLKYLGEEGEASRIERAVAVSVPCDLAGSADQLATPGNRLYMWNFMRSLRAKMQQKAEAFPNQIDISGLDAMKTFHAFDDRFTAPLHGFRDAQHYWASCSSMHFLGGIRVPTLLLNAKDDPFLSDGCFPVETCSNSDHVFLEMPDWGGHVGFLDGAQTYAEQRAVSFLSRDAGA
ncbi:MAG: alpha/beta fold hydrolase [Bacteroidota bacterium]|nr:alpha/beta fold hydrolase [Bacteroidota bacterium]